jgi:amino acid transporter
MNKELLYKASSIVLYIAAALLVVFAIWSYTHSADIVSQARAAGQDIDRYTVVSFYMDSSAMYVVYALLLIAAGLVLQKKQMANVEAADSENPTQNNAFDEELDDWFNEIDDADSDEPQS